jgi:hypothetical protein
MALFFAVLAVVKGQKRNFRDIDNCIEREERLLERRERRRGALRLRGVARRVWAEPVRRGRGGKRNG